MKKMLSRKILVWVVDTLILILLYFRTKDPGTHKLIIFMIVLLGIIVIGGIVYKDFIKSRFFQPGLVDKSKDAINYGISNEDGN